MSASADLDPDGGGTWIDQLRWGPDGLITVIAQEAGTHKILMVAHMNQEALQATVQTRQAVYWSRSRARLWRKGEESGNLQQVSEIRTDCDGDVLLLTVAQVGGIACHTGRHSCFFNRLDAGRWVAVEPVLADPADLYRKDRMTPTPDESPDTALGRLADVIESRRGGDAEKSYVARLLARGEDAILKKIGEEATETVMAAKDGDRARIVAETADLWFHSMVMLAHYGLRPEDVVRELVRREGQSGLDEKALRKVRE